ncbi:MAG: hypothetical protein J7518_18990 [Nocardioidaceae bacterium]|nr:hypothetical protein [Nocardioidaceae bacterium]
MNDSTPAPRTVSVPHLVFGLIFLGIATVRWIAVATDADLPKTAIGFPLVLIGAGIVGLVAAVVNNRRRSKALTRQLEEPAETTEDTLVIEEEQ